MTQEQPPRNAEFVTEEMIEMDVGRSASSGEFVPVYVARGWRDRFIVHHFRRLIRRGARGRFVSKGGERNADGG